MSMVLEGGAHELVFDGNVDHHNRVEHIKLREHLAACSINLKRRSKEFQVYNQHFICDTHVNYDEPCWKPSRT